MELLADGHLVRSIGLIGTTVLDIADIAPGLHCWRIVSGDVPVDRGTVVIEQ